MLDTKSHTPSLLVFADDWGRHPSSCQHLIRHLVDHRHVYWVNTIGTREPRLNLASLRRGVEKISNWIRRPAAGADPLPANLHVLNPKMWPWTSRRFDQALNRELLFRQLAPLIRSLPAPPIAVTTLPIVSDLMGLLPVQRWVYYCVDDFGEWPGLAQAALRQMEERLILRADTLIAVSETLQNKIAQRGRQAQLLTHGIEPDFWKIDGPAKPLPQLEGLPRPLVVFWGVIDRRMDVAFVKHLAGDLTHGTVVLVGRQDDPDPALLAIPCVAHVPALPFADLPHLAAAASVLIMPYDNLPVTRAMQPLKLKEYLATGRPVVVRDLPANRSWSDCMDLSDTPGEFVRSVRLRIEQGLPEAQTRRVVGLQGKPGQKRPGVSRTGPLAHRTCVILFLRQSMSTMPVVLDTRVVAGSGGGPDKTILKSPRFLLDGGYRMICAYMHAPTDPGFEQLQHKAQLWQAPLVSVHDRGPWDWKVISQMLDICRRERVQIWHGHDYKSNALGLLLKRFWPMHLVTTVHGWVQQTRRTLLYYWIDRLCLPRYELVICVSPDLYECSRASGVSKNRCVLIENGVDTNEYSRRNDVGEAKRKLEMNPERLLVGAVGRLSAEKGFDILIRSVDQLLRQGLDLELAIVGEGDEKRRLQTLIAELGRSDRIHLLGYRSDTPAVYEAMDLFTLSSLREGLPNVLLEAMAMEVPVLATRIAGVPRLIQSEENGLLVEPGSIGELTGGLARLVRDVGFRRRLSAAGRRTVETCYSFSARMVKIQTLYDNMLGRRSSMPANK